MHNARHHKLVSILINPSLLGSAGLLASFFFLFRLSFPFLFSFSSFLSYLFSFPFPLSFLSFSRFLFRLGQKLENPMALLGHFSLYFSFLSPFLLSSSFLYLLKTFSLLVFSVSNPSVSSPGRCAPNAVPQSIKSWRSQTQLQCQCVLCSACHFARQTISYKTTQNVLHTIAKTSTVSLQSNTPGRQSPITNISHEVTVHVLSWLSSWHVQPVPRIHDWTIKSCWCTHDVCMQRTNCCESNQASSPIRFGQTCLFKICTSWFPSNRFVLRHLFSSSQLRS